MEAWRVRRTRRSWRKRNAWLMLPLAPPPSTLAPRQMLHALLLPPLHAALLQTSSGPPSRAPSLLLLPLSPILRVARGKAMAPNGTARYETTKRIIPHPHSTKNATELGMVRSQVLRDCIQGVTK